MIPLGAGLDGVSIPASPELLRYRPALAIISLGYFALLVTGFVTGNVSNTLEYVFVLIAGIVMLMRQDQCMVQCLIPFFLFAVMTAFFDIVQLIDVAFRSYPGIKSYFSVTCPRNVTGLLGANTTVYTTSGSQVVLPPGTQVIQEQDQCNWQWVVANVAQLVAVVLDLAASSFGWRMVKTSMGQDMGPMGGGMLGAGGGGRFDDAYGPMQVGGGPPPSAGPGPGQGPGRRLGGGAPQGAAQLPGFQPFQGQGQVLRN